MLSARCHCGAVEVRAPRPPETLTNCNCSICRRYGALWAYYPDTDVTLMAAPDATDEYVWGDRSQKFIRCKHCGCVMQWRKLMLGPDTRTGVNARNFEPSAIDGARIRLLDGAQSWNYLDQALSASSPPVA
jgi:hypothetical protein